MNGEKISGQRRSTVLLQQILSWNISLALGFLLVDLFANRRQAAAKKTKWHRSEMNQIWVDSVIWGPCKQIAADTANTNNFSRIWLCYRSDAATRDVNAIINIVVFSPSWQQQQKERWAIWPKNKLQIYSSEIWLQETPGSWTARLG